MFGRRVSGQGKLCSSSLAITEGHGDAAMVLLRAGAETDKRDMDGNLAISLAPDKKATLANPPLLDAVSSPPCLDTRFHIAKRRAGGY